MDNQSTLADEILLLRCQVRDERAFEQLVAHYDGKLRYYVRRLTGGIEHEDDVLQNVWLAVWVQLPKLRNPERFRVWLYRIARNIALQRYRQRPSVPLDEDVPTPEPPEEGFTPEEAAAVHAALDRITPQHREVLVLRFLEGLSYEEIAGVVGCSVGTIRSRIYYGKRSLRSEMEAGENG
jgi:RNA polymerase sigma-70 factor (ECF subfamily)